MTSFVDIDVKVDDFDFDIEALVNELLLAVMDYEKCEYEASINLVITESEQVREYNKEYRNKDMTTDVLSFPAIDMVEPGNFEIVSNNEAAYFDPDSGELLLGDIIINADRVRSQAIEYGHSIKREFSFLVTHSLFHLCGYDHETPYEAAQMEKRQEDVLTNLGITRE